MIDDYALTLYKDTFKQFNRIEGVFNDAIANIQSSSFDYEVGKLFNDKLDEIVGKNEEIDCLQKEINDKKIALFEKANDLKKTCEIWDDFLNDVLEINELMRKEDYLKVYEKTSILQSMLFNENGYFKMLENWCIYTLIVSGYKFYCTGKYTLNFIDDFYHIILSNKDKAIELGLSGKISDISYDFYHKSYGNILSIFAKK